MSELAMMLNYPFDLPEPDSIHHLSTETLRRHAALALSVNRFDVSAEYQAELARQSNTEMEIA